MRIACIAFAAGALLLQQQADLPAPAVLGALLGIATAAAAAATTVGRPSRATHRFFVARTATIGLAAFVIGFAWAAWRAEDRLADALPRALEGVDVVLVGLVAQLPNVDAHGVRFAFDVERVESRDTHGRPLVVPRHLSLAWYAPWGSSAAASALPRIEPGQRWRLAVRLKRPHGAANPYGFDYEYWLLEEGMRATGAVRPGVDDDDSGGALERHAVDARTGKLAEFVWGPSIVVERVRARLRERILTLLAGDRPLRDSAPYAGVLVALVVGDQRAIAASDWTVFNRTGIGHLVSISGLHVSMLAAMGAWLVFRLWRRHPAWGARLPAHKAAALAGTSVAFVYCLLAGFGVPAQRTLYMIAVVALALWAGRLTPASRVLCIALGLVVVLDPWAVTGAGFWLSFTAVAAIFYVTAGRVSFAHPDDSRAVRWRRAIAAAIKVQWAVTLALTPLTLLFFFQVSVVSPIANAVAIPLVSFVVTPLALAGSILPGPLAAWALRLAHALVSALATWLEWLSGFDFAVWSGAAPGPAACAAAMLGVAWWLAPRGMPSRWLGAFWMTPLFAWPGDTPPPFTARITALDVGQGTAVLVETRTTRVLYDTGPRYAPGNDAGLRIIVPYLRARGIAHLDVLVISHNDSDHSGGALSVMQAIRIDRATTSLAPDSAIVGHARPHVRCVAGQRWTSDGVTFEMLHPRSDAYAVQAGVAPATPNAKSCVLRVEAAHHAMLLTGDIERPQEATLVARAGAALDSDVVLVPHHGSRTSSSEALLDTVAPSYAIVQAGYLNRFGHPRPNVLARYDERHIAVSRTDRDGAITVALDERGVSVSRFRETHRRYWYGA